ncbi:MAG TPA: adenylate/guanylate cyclase domain-containing protein [Burkholderiaceae bacterium]|jgi:adenylate cyclase
MSSQSYVEIAQRPISFKIFGIAVGLLTLMVIVTLSSSIYLHRVGQQLTLLSDYYIELDQQMSDIRAQTLREIIQIERVLHAKPRQVTGRDDEVAGLYKQAGDCSDESLRAVRRKIKDAYSDFGERNLMAYRVTRLCTDNQLTRADALIDRALATHRVRDDVEQVARFTKLKTELADLPAERLKLYVSFEKYLERAQSRDDKELAAIHDQIDEHRADVARRINAVTGLIHTGTNDSADRTEAMEHDALWLSWSVTLAACIFGLGVAALITRNLVRPVRELLALTHAIRTGNLDIQIQIKTSDEIGLLADSFKHMVGEIKQKEQIKNMFGKYVDPRIVQSLLLDQQQFKHGGERQLMSVFFSDIEGFTPICEGLTPTGAVRLINQYFALMSEPVRNRKGIIDKFIGDSIMAYWGPPFTVAAEHALEACHAALEQQALVPKFQALLPEVLGIRKNVPTIRVRMGIATGDVTVGSIGSEDARSYTVIGDTVNLASRLEGANKYYHTQILISEDTCKLAGDGIEAREVDAIRVVGKADPVRVYELLGMKGDISAAGAQLRSHYERGLGLYRARKWEEARAAFEECLKVKPDDGPSLLFIERIAVLKGKDLTEQWDGVWRLTEK